MRTTNKFCLLLLAIITIALVTWIIWSKATTFRKAGHSNRMSEEKQGQRGLPKNPCWFATGDFQSISYEVISKREDRQMRGYPEDIPMSEAIRIFNEEKQGVSHQTNERMGQNSVKIG